MSFSVTGLPAGASGTLVPTSVIGSGSSVLSVSTLSTTVFGSYPLSIRGTSGSLTHSAPVTLVVGTPTAATPRFSPLPGTFSSSVNVTLSDTTPGAVVPDGTTDGSTPTASSPACTMVNLKTTTTINAIAVASGYNNSALVSGIYTIVSDDDDQLRAGFTAAGMQLNGNTTLNGTRLRLTDGGANEASSAFFSTAVNVQSFTTDFSLQLTSASADGMAFVIQNNGVTAMGPSGGGLGYGPDAPTVCLCGDEPECGGEV